MPIEKDMALVRMEVEGQAAVEQVFCAAQVFQASQRVAPRNHRATVATKAQTFTQSPPLQLSRSFVGITGREVDGPVRIGVTIVIDHQRPFAAVAVRVREHILIYGAVWREEIVEQEIAALGKQPATLEQR